MKIIDEKLPNETVSIDTHYNFKIKKEKTRPCQLSQERMDIFEYFQTKFINKYL